MVYGSQRPTVPEAPLWELFFDAGTGTTYTSNGPSAQVFSGKWVYAVQEYNGTATVIYTNGTLMASNTQTYKPLTTSPNNRCHLSLAPEMHTTSVFNLEWKYTI